MLFQFQFGTIGSPAGLRFGNAFQCFNSSLVRLGASKEWTSKAFFACFNSSLVRLGESYRRAPAKTEQFQFQFGTIGSVINHRHRRNFSICFNSSLVRLGVAYLLYRRNHTIVSIPVWYDWESMNNSSYRYIEHVSIPVWYDWEMDSSPFLPVLVCFNSSLVRLGGVW